MNLPNAYRVAHVATGKFDDTVSTTGTYFIIRDDHGTQVYFRDTASQGTSIDGYIPDTAGCFVSVFTDDSVAEGDK